MIAWRRTLPDEPEPSGIGKGASLGCCLTLRSRPALVAKMTGGSLQHEGLKLDLEPWEDGYWSSHQPDAFEWWYLEPKLELAIRLGDAPAREQDRAIC